MPTRQLYIVGPKNVILALQTRIDNRAGLPARVGRRWNPTTRIHDVQEDGSAPLTLHVVDVCEHPTDTTLAALEVDPIVVHRLAALRDAILAKAPETRTAMENAILSLEAERALGPEWTAQETPR